jgi:hypothetical protein
MNHGFEPGDKVRVQGVGYSVIRYLGKDQRGLAICGWTEKGQEHRKCFPFEALEKSAAPEVGGR